MPEPVELWERAGLLAAMYSGTLSLVAFQQTALITRYASIVEALRTPGVRLIITERSIESDRAVFAKLHVTQPIEIAAYAASHDSLRAALPPDLQHGTILLDAPLESLVSRVKQRAREAETEDAVGEDYLSQLNDAHSAFFETVAWPKRTVDASGPPASVAALVSEAISAIQADHGMKRSSGGPTSPNSITVGLELAF